MNDARWQRVQQLFWAARELAPDAREAMLRASSEDDSALVDEVRRMLAADTGDGILDHTAPITPLADRVGDVPVREQVGPYLVTEEIGRGGMGVVYRAHDPRLRRDVALKFLPFSSTRDPDAKSRFIGEARAASALDHPHNCPVYDVGSTDDGRLYIAMAYCAGGSLAARLASGPLPIDDAIRITTQVAGALDSAHEAGIVHRDVKPGNIAFTERGEARVLDFGVAVLGTEEWAAPRVSAGTPAYMAPEQVRGGPVDRRTDVWALGAVLFEMLTGRRAFPGTNTEATHAITRLAPGDIRTLRPEIPAAIAAVVARALEKDPAKRFATAADLASALHMARTGTLPGAADRRRRLTRVAITAGVAALVATVAWFGARLARSAAAGNSVDANAVAILPFRVSGEASIGYLREGMIDLLAAKLTGEGGLRAADPRGVYAAWRRAAGRDDEDLPADSAIALASRLGAGNVLQGDVVGTAASLVVNATVVNVDGREVGRASVQGPHTDLSTLVDRLVAQLLTVSAGEEPQRLGALTSTSLPALRAYLDGQALYRRGRYGDALEQFGRALDADSTFALAGLGLALADGWVGTGHASERGRAAAWRSRDRLSARDRALLIASVGPAYPRAPTIREQLTATEDALKLAPDRLELWYTLGDHYFHHGRVLGDADWEIQAARALARAVAGDSAFAPALHHLLTLSARQGRRDDVRTLAAASRTYIREGATMDFIRWRTAVALGSEGPTVASLDSMATETIGWIGMISQDDGVDRPYGEQALRTRDARPGTREERLERHLSVHAVALNGGRPRDAVQLSEAIRSLQPDSSFHLRLRVLAALYADGDRASAARAAESLGARRPADRADRINACVLEQWRLLEGDADRAASNAQVAARTPGSDTTRSRASDRSTWQTPARTVTERLCQATVDAIHATNRRDPAARQSIERLTDLYGVGPVEFYPGDGHVEYVPLVLARLLEASGDHAGALSAIRRRPYFIGWQPFLATSLRQEGRLAEIVGDRDGARRAYEHYLVLRHTPDPTLRPAVDSVRAELARLR